MFLCDVVRNKFKFCICEGAWSSCKIINTIVTEDVLNFYMTVENGNRCLIFSQRRGEIYPKESFPISFTFKPLQHVKLESIGGDVVLVGNGYEGAASKKNTNNFPPNCSFADEDDWKRMEKVGKLPIDVSQVNNTKGTIGSDMIGVSSEDFEKEIEKIKEYMQNKMENKSSI